MNNPRISVILTSYNHAKYVSQTIESILNQDFTNYELIIIDDNSTDNSVEIINNFNDPRIKFVAHRENIGMALRVNEAIILSRSEYIAHINSDDFWNDHQKLSKQIEFLDKNSEYQVVFTRANLINEDGSPKKTDNVFDRQHNQDRYEWLRFFFFMGNCLCYPSVMIRRKLFDEIGLYNPKYGILLDLDMWIRICKKYEIYILPDKTTSFREGINSTSYNQNSVSNHEMNWVLENYTNINFDDFKKIFKNQIGQNVGVNESNYLVFLLRKLLKSKTNLVHDIRKFSAYKIFYYMNREYPELNFSYKDFVKEIKNYVNDSNLDKSRYYFLNKNFFYITIHQNILRVKFCKLRILKLKLFN